MHNFKWPFLSRAFYFLFQNFNPVEQILETQGEIDKKPLENDAKNIIEFEQTIVRVSF